ncbi:MAG TPA: D-aminoacyl-tRNA deacylase [Tepidiformaceae bacterium]|nr:D-aminoacyl-tRNA deacylase [Tepidiformaceae bacterium]
MRLVVQRVSRASVSVMGSVVAAIGPGLAILVGVTEGDSETLARSFAAKVAELRIFEDADGKMNRSVQEIGGAVLAVSQFTLYADTRRGRRPSFAAAARPDRAQPVYGAFCDAFAEHGLDCQRGVFGAHMEIALVNDGPVTIILDSIDLERPRRT